MAPLILLIAVASTAADAGQDRVIVLAASQVVPKSSTAELSFSLPDVRQGEQVRLALDARVNYSGWCANNPAMVAAVNGSAILGADLINKPLEYHCKNGRDAFWSTPGGSSWLLFSWPDFSVERVRAYASPVAIVETDPFHFVWDITRHVKPGKNTVSVRHDEITAEAHWLALRDVRVEVGPPLESGNRSIMVTPAPTGDLPTYVPRGPQPLLMRAALSRVRLSTGGAIRLTAGERTLNVASRTSEPAGRWATTGEDAWQPIPPGTSRKAEWSCHGYRVTRTVAVRDDHLHVTDTFTSTSRSLGGVMCENRLVISEKPIETRLAGRPPYAASQIESAGPHPTVMARWRDLVVGLVAEDDVFRAHCLAFARPDSVGLADHELGISPGQSQTVEWSIYPIPRGDYWDFVNAVRRNWGANYPIPGPHVFVDWSFAAHRDEYLRNWVRSRGISMVSSPDAMFDEGKAAMGTAIPMAKTFCARTAGWIRQLHAAAPGVKALVYINCSLSTEPGAAAKYADSKLVDPSGNQLTMAAGSPQGVTMAPLFISTTEDSYGRAMMKVVRYIIEDLGADGVYHDVLCSANYGARAYRTAWDGATVMIDPNTHEVSGKCSSVALLQRSWHVALVEYLRGRGKTIIGNGPVETRTMLQLKIPVFVETGFTNSSALETHFGSPWAYGNQPWADPHRGFYYNTAYSLRRLLNYGAVLALPGWSEEPKGTSFLQRIYPITPLEIRAGMVLGEERIITNRSGRYGWPDGSPAEVYVFDANGKQVAQPRVREHANEQGSVLTEVRMPSDHFAVLVRKGEVRH